MKINIVIHSILHQCHVEGIISSNKLQSAKIHIICKISCNILLAQDFIKSKLFKLKISDPKIIEKGIKNIKSFFSTILSNSNKFNIHIIKSIIQAVNILFSLVLEKK